ncbi:uncharacterized protein F4807DRAFT_162135 [Annulohypoxylon truncatum]|uniref:uncharacterized protein n=1 Tax=Annulohypoxylon truncatum TaxID=327061 RepID=UPI00200834DB|nr:uncharacterized protein F4807DRAFT_162135 [Annulohypoxylon truncatum]KAI1208016.1 hypothetical protein F4807DRAFT_162135 [Annulohypoxylon truncatum]
MSHIPNNTVMQFKSEEFAPTSSTTDMDDWRKELIGPNWKKGEMRQRHVSVQWYKAGIRVDIRRWFSNYGELQPAKDGISLNEKEFECLVLLVPEIRAQITQLKAQKRKD